MPSLDLGLIFRYGKNSIPYLISPKNIAMQAWAVIILSTVKGESTGLRILMMLFNVSFTGKSRDHTYPLTYI